jgi:hypothetical protein
MLIVQTIVRREFMRVSAKERMFVAVVAAALAAPCSYVVFRRGPEIWSIALLLAVSAQPFLLRTAAVRPYVLLLSALEAFLLGMILFGYAFEPPDRPNSLHTGLPFEWRFAFGALAFIFFSYVSSELSSREREVSAAEETRKDSVALGENHPP